MPEIDLPADEEVAAFVERFLVSFAAWDLLVLLHAQPGIVESPVRLAYRLGRPEPDVTAATEALAAGGMLDVVSGGDDPVYRVTDDPHLREVLERFASLASNREWRLELVRRVLTRAG